MRKLDYEITYYNDCNGQYDIVYVKGNNELSAKITGLVECGYDIIKVRIRR